MVSNVLKTSIEWIRERVKKLARMITSPEIDIRVQEGEGGFEMSLYGGLIRLWFVVSQRTAKLGLERSLSTWGLNEKQIELINTCFENNELSVSTFRSILKLITNNIIVQKASEILKKKHIHTCKRKGLFYIFSSNKNLSLPELSEDHTEMNALCKDLGLTLIDLQTNFYYGSVYLISSYLEGYSTPTLLNPYMIPKIDETVSYVKMKSCQNLPQSFNDFKFTYISSLVPERREDKLIVNEKEVNFNLGKYQRANEYR